MFGELQPWIIGDSSTLAAWENDQQDKIYQMLNYFENKHPHERWVLQNITAEDIDEAMQMFEIDYPNLPQFLKDKIDEIDLI